MSLSYVQALDSVVFSPLSQAEIASTASIQITPENPEDVSSSRLGVIKGGNCVNCGENRNGCIGEFGYIEWTEPVIHPLFYKNEVVDLLRVICYSCHRLTLGDPLALEHKISSTIQGRVRFNAVREMTKVNNCVWCQYPRQVYTVSGTVHAMNRFWCKEEAKKRIIVPMSDQEIADILRDLKDEDLKAIGMNPDVWHPKELCLTRFPVVPVCVRPPVKGRSQMMEDDLTVMYRELLRKLEPVDDPAREAVRRTKFVSLIHSIIDNTSLGETHVSSKRPYKGSLDRLIGKSGYVRGAMLGKRVNFAARTVITCDADLPLDTVGVPRCIINEQSYPERVTRWNKSSLQELVDTGKIKRVVGSNGKQHDLQYHANHKEATRIKRGDIIYRGSSGWNSWKRPGDFVLKSSDLLYRGGVHRKISDPNLIIDDDDILLSESGYVVSDIERAGIVVQGAEPIDIITKVPRRIDLRIGDLVHRPLRDGDWAIANRQPTLWAGSMMALKIKIIDSIRSIALPYGLVSPLNADFDGDEINLHFPQSVEEVAECSVLFSVSAFTLAPDSTVHSFIQDTPLAAYKLSKEDIDPFYAHSFGDLCTKLEIPFEALNELDRVCEMEGWPNRSSRSVLALAFPRTMKYESKTVKMKYGRVYEGAMTKSDLHRILRLIAKYHSGEDVVNFLTKIQRVACFTMERMVHSILPEDCLATPESHAELRREVHSGLLEVQAIESDDNPYMKEDRIILALSNLSNTMQRVGTKHVHPDNRFLDLLHSGAKGSASNLAQIMAGLGIQLVEGRRIKTPINYGRRMTAHTDPRDTSQTTLNLLEWYSRRGFIARPFSVGLTPHEMFSLMISGRTGVCSTSIMTANAGYAERRLVNHMTIYSIAQDGSLRGLNGKILQLRYGGHGISADHTEISSSTGSNVTTFIKVSDIVDDENSKVEIK